MAPLSQSERTRKYAEWLKDSQVGGVLTQYLTPEDARVWIKDGPMKEYARALAGIGKYAGLIETPALSASEVVARALGADWHLVPESTRVKPLRCLAERGMERTLVVWGPSRDFKHLLWAALKATDAKAQPPAQVVVTETFERQTPATERERQRRFARRCGFEVSHLRV